MRRWWVRALLGLTAAVALLLGWGLLVEPRLVLDRERLEVSLPRLSGEWTGTELAVLSDLQVGARWANTGMVERAVATVVDARPDAVLVAGDLVHDAGPAAGRRADEVLDLLAPLVEARLPTYAVLGDRDHAAGAVDELTRALGAVGIAVLRDEARRLAPPTGESPVADLYVVGLGAERAAPDAAFAGVPDDAARVVLMHDPTAFAALPADSAPLAVAGHTHCGQVAVPGMPRWTRPGLSAEEEVVAGGWAPAEHGAAGNQLFVTCGVGLGRAPVRLFAPPQVVFVELSPASTG
ncbi:metallophosphoesterase [Modestobacter italicus]|uniref:metallophosphoesterase n=1 Tax=Modestobacter italicus (strain DSM 44449 / CECT 9708 / BC 501) TaxID=2732864 RepID=UPI001C951D4B|nr:metallophosphoesterase [Modestobacter italicus]